MMTAHILFGATNQATRTLDLWATQTSAASGAVDLGVPVVVDFDPVRIGAVGLFIGGNASGMAEIWSTDGTAAGTQAFALRDNSGQLLAINAMQGFAGEAVVAATNPVTHLDSVWLTDGTAAGSTLLLSGIAASAFQVVGSTLYFTGAPDPYRSASALLYRSNGTPGGTFAISAPGSVVAPDAYVPVSNGSVLFENDRNAGGTQASSLWITNGTLAGTHALTVANLGSDGGGNAFISLNGVALFGFAVSGRGGSGLWVSNGTAGGSRQLVIAGGATILSSIASLTAVGSSVVFTATDQNGTSGLWRTDGTDAGTYLLGAFSSIASLTAFAGQVAFTALDIAGHSGLFVTDGTAAGTHEVLPANASSTGLDPLGVFTYFDRIGLTGTDARGVQGLWLSDGTNAGTSEAALPVASIIQTTTTGVAGSGSVVTLPAVAGPYHAGDGDTIRAGTGGVVVDPSAAVLVTGGTGPLTFVGGTDSSTVTGGTGPQTLIGGSGGGSFAGGSVGHNILVAGGGNTTLIGGGNADELFGAATGATVMVAGAGRESLIGGGGATTMTGGAGTGCVIFTGNGNATVSGGDSGADTIVGGGGKLAVNARNGEAAFAGSGATTFTGSIGGADSVIGGSGSLSVNGQGANMIVVGETGPATVQSSTGYCLAFQGSGPMSIASGGGPLRIVAGNGSASIIAASGGVVLDVVKGAAGGLDVVSGFNPLRDHIYLFGYAASDVVRHVQNGAATISLADGTRVILLGVSDPGPGISII